MTGNRKIIREIKNDKKGLIEKQSRSTYGVIFGPGSRISPDVCYARLGNQVRNMPDRSMCYLFRYDAGDIFDYDSLFKELRKIFEGFFEIWRYRSGNENVRIIYVGEKIELNRMSRYMAYYMLFVLLRAIDAERIHLWKRTNLNGLNNWRDVIYHHYATLGIHGHNINDNLYHLGRQLDNKYHYHVKDKEKRAKIQNEFVEKIDDFIKTLTKAFGRNTKWNIDDFEQLSRYYTRGQTRVFNKIKEYIDDDKE